MKGISLTFTKQQQTDVDEMNNPINEQYELVVDDCLIAPISEPTNAREEQAMRQSREQLRIHLPKVFSGDISDSDVVWQGRVFHIDSDSVVFMLENTPTRWNRYFRAELVANYGSVISQSLLDSFITEDGENYFTSENAYYYLQQEMVI